MSRGGQREREIGIFKWGGSRGSYPLRKVWDYTFLSFFFPEVCCGKIRRSNPTPLPEDEADIDSDYPTSIQDNKMDKTVRGNEKRKRIKKIIIK